MGENLLRSLSEETNFEMTKDARSLHQTEPKGSGLRHNLLSEDFHDRCPNIYEAVIIMSHRARQIGQKQARVIESFMSTKSKSEEGEADMPDIFQPDDDEDDGPKLPRFEKPTVIAMNEMFKGVLDWKYKEK